MQGLIIILFLSMFLMAIYAAIRVSTEGNIKKTIKRIYKFCMISKNKIINYIFVTIIFILMSPCILVDLLLEWMIHLICSITSFLAHLLTMMKKYKKENNKK